ncbi:MAG: eL32 family ribosomal protein [Nanoarchaeota archaeon]
MGKFLRRNSDRHSKLGRNRKKKQIWRKPKGRHNKMRDKKRGYPAVVKIGYRKSNGERRKLEGRDPILIMNLKDLGKMDKGKIGVIGAVGKKKKIEMVKKAKENKISLYNINIEKFLKENQRKEKQKENAVTASAGAAIQEGKK